jgi:squalene-hopene/tetraprenyl-beta-curcumene cyclase
MIIVNSQPRPNVFVRFAAIRGALLIAGVFLATDSAALAQYEEKPPFQYELDDAQYSIPSADEPRVAEFGSESLKAAAKYLEVGAVSWARGRACVNCHTTGPYLTDFSSLSDHFGKPNEEVRASFAKAVPKEIEEVQEVNDNGHSYYPSAFFSVWRSAGLAEWDRNVSGQLGDATDKSLREMFTRQSANGAFVSHGEVEIPHITTDFELSLQAARAITAAPGWLANLKDENLLSRIKKLKEWLKSAPPKNDFDRILKLQLATYFPECVTPAERENAMAILTAKQHEDGGWSTRDMSDVKDWHYVMSPKVLTLINGLPDAAKPESDAYMTALAIVLMRQNDVTASDPRIKRGLAWLKREQRVSGRWWMHSLYRGNYHYTSYIATVEALKALDLCGELDGLAVNGNGIR